MTLPWGSARFDQAAAHSTAAAAVPPTVLHLTSPDDFAAGGGSGPWGWINCSGSYPTTGGPPLFNTTASEIISGTSSGFAAMRTTIPITMVSGTHYSLTGYIKNLVAPVWVAVAIIDSLSTGTNYVIYWVDATSGAGAPGSSQAGGGGVIDSGFTVVPDSNNYSKVVMIFHFTSTPGSDAIVDIRFVDSNSGSTPTNSQAFFAYQWGA
jgi:hypothetical protein